MRFFRALLWPTIATLLGVALLANLGFWQLRRLGEKEALVTRIESRMVQAPQDLPFEAAWSADETAALDYAPAKVSGLFLHQFEVLVFEPAAKGEGGMATKGFAVLTPLKLEDGRIIIINRGFVPEAFGPASARLAGQVEGKVTVQGVFRAPQRRGTFTPADEPAKNLWYTRDPAAIAAAFKLEHVAPFLLDADATSNPGGWPKGGATELKIPNNHLQYAGTWFALALTLIGFYAFFARSIWRQMSKNTPQ